MHGRSWQATSPDLIMRANGDCAIAEVMLHLAADGIMVRRSFELDSACASLAHNICPHAGHAPCECRLTVLILLDRHHCLGTPITHRNAGVSEFYLVDSRGLYPKTDFDAEIRATLVALGANRKNDGPDGRTPWATDTALCP